jgi:hypothetical protein
LGIDAKAQINLSMQVITLLSKKILFRFLFQFCQKKYSLIGRFFYQDQTLLLRASIPSRYANLPFSHADALVVEKKLLE